MVIAMRARQAAVAVLALASPALGACGGSAGHGRPSPRRWLSLDSSAHSATITLVAAYDATAGGFNLNGANKGALLFAVPSGWRVTVRCVNNASDRRYACALVRSPGAPAVAEPQAGRTPELDPGAQAGFSFTAGASTRYRLVALTGGREPVGMWLTLQIVRSGLPSVRRVR
jgi:Sulfocyanin (SoxE) domain